MKVYVIINKMEDHNGAIEHVFFNEEDAIQMLDSFYDHCDGQFYIQEHEVIE